MYGLGSISKPQGLRNNRRIQQSCNRRISIFRGDHPIDCLTALNAGIQFIGVLTGFHSEGDFRSCMLKNIIFLKSEQFLNPALNLL